MPQINLGKVTGEKGDPFTYDDFTPEQLDGITPKILKGNVTTLDPDQNATVDIRKEGLNNYIDFGIPRGMNGSEMEKVSAENVEMEDGTTAESAISTLIENVSDISNDIDAITEPTFDDTTEEYNTLDDANDAAETTSNEIQSNTSLLTTLSNIKKTFSAIIQGLKILGTNVGMIQGITSELNSESDYIAASSKALATVNSKLNKVSSYEYYTIKIPKGESVPLTFKGAPIKISDSHVDIIQVSTTYTSTFQYRRYLVREGGAPRLLDNIAPSSMTANFNVPEIFIDSDIVKVRFEGNSASSVYNVGVIVERLG